MSSRDTLAATTLDATMTEAHQRPSLARQSPSRPTGKRETEAFNAGVRAALDLARGTADALAPLLVRQPTRINFAMAALDGLADEGEALLLPSPSSTCLTPVFARETLPAPVVSGPTASGRERLEAKARGYNGEACTECGNFTLTRNGTCLKCNTCGATSGCS